MTQRWMPWLTYGFVPCAVAVAIVILALISPRWDNGPLGQLWIGRDWQTAIRLPGDTIACPEQIYQEQPGLPLISLNCETLIEGKPLTISVSHNTTMTLKGTCAATYAGHAIRCESQLEPNLYDRLLPIVSLDSDLGIPPARQQALRRQHPLLYFSESHWVLLLLTYATLVTALEILLVWQSRRAFRVAARPNVRRAIAWWAANVAGGVILWLVVNAIFLFSLLSFKFID